MWTRREAVPTRYLNNIKHLQVEVVRRDRLMEPKDQSFGQSEMAVFQIPMSGLLRSLTKSSVNLSSPAPAQPRHSPIAPRKTIKSFAHAFGLVYTTKTITMAAARPLYNALFRRNFQMLGVVFVSAFAFEMAYDTGMNKVWDNINKGRQWKDIRSRYVEEE
ncbi:ubiquinol-cytochrome C reductase [Nemania serpens]|nr:ubiquinol-cytochrome C reductase [Nemania serpens]